MAIDVEHAYRRYGPMVLRCCSRLLHDPQDAQEATQDTFVRLVRRDETLDDHALGGLLYRIATNVCLNRIRSRARHPEDPGSGLIERIACCDDPAEVGMARSMLDRIFGREPESTRVIAVLLYVEGMTLEEVAATVGLSVSGVRHRIRQLQQQLHLKEAA